jgi:hypothetical protein
VIKYAITVVTSLQDSDKRVVTRTDQYLLHTGAVLKDLHYQPDKFADLSSNRCIVERVTADSV